MTPTPIFYVKQKRAKGDDCFLTAADWYSFSPETRQRDRIAPGTEYLNANNNYYCLFIDGAIRKVWNVFYRKDVTVFQTIILSIPSKAEQGWCYDVQENTGCVKYVPASEAVGTAYKTYRGALNYSQEITQELYYDLYEAE